MVPKCHCGRVTDLRARVTCDCDVATTARLLIGCSGPDTTPEIVPVRFTTSCSHTRGHSQKCRCRRSVSQPANNDFDSRVDWNWFLSLTTAAAPNIRTHTHTHTHIYKYDMMAAVRNELRTTTARPGVAYTSRNPSCGYGLTR